MDSVERAQLVVIGAGPAGLNAAIEARRAGVESVLVLDDGFVPGGQIFRRFGPRFSVTDSVAAGHEFREGDALISEALACGCEIRSRTIVWGIWGKQVAFAQEDGKSGSVEAEAIIIASGARDRPIAFPGWTLPGVFTAGAAKTLVAIQRVLPGQRILMAGSGPLALAFSAQLREYGANVVEVAEAAPRPTIFAALRLLASGEFQLLRDGIQYMVRLKRDRIPFHHSTIIVRVEGKKEVEVAVVASVDAQWRVIPGTERRIDVDTVLLGYGLEASSELYRLIGCQLHYDRDLGGWIPVKSERMATSLPGIFAAGDGSGIGGSRFAIQEGRIAGIWAAFELGKIAEPDAANRARPAHRRLRSLGRFRSALNRIYHVGPGIHGLAKPDTVICRCEEKLANELDELISKGVTDPNIVRAQSRIGMGRCQGRNCASYVAATISTRCNIPIEDLPALSVRPPVRPVPISAIACERKQPAADVAVSWEVEKNSSTSPSKPVRPKSASSHG